MIELGRGSHCYTNISVFVSSTEAWKPMNTKAWRPRSPKAQEPKSPKSQKPDRLEIQKPKNPKQRSLKVPKSKSPEDQKFYLRSWKDQRSKSLNAQKPENSKAWMMSKGLEAKNHKKISNKFLVYRHNCRLYTNQKS